MKKHLKDLLWYTVGSIIYAIAVTIFISANEISPGGLTGIATLLNYTLHVPTGLTILVLNIPILILGYIKFGGKFIISTAVATTMVSFAITFVEEVVPAVKVDKILASIFGGCLLGLGISLIMLHGATTGGVDIVAKLINKRFRHFTVGKIILILDAAVILLAVIVYKNIESALYSVVTMFASARVMDSMLYGGDRGKVIYTITSKPDEICKSVSQELSRGITLFDVTGGYTGEKRKMLMCSLRPFEVSLFYSLVEKYDPKAFIIVTEAGEIIGEGFKKLN
ncbi:MAG: YitT family protein [Clostridia bacterium]|nr:YitT family protein [Clostridia bacterium]